MTEEGRLAQAGMRDVPRNLETYFLVLLRKGERWNETTGREAENLVPEQLAFLRRQFEARRYLSAGPALDGGEIAGMAILEAETPEQAMALASEDPGVRAGRLRVELHPVLLPSLACVKVQY